MTTNKIPYQTGASLPEEQSSGGSEPQNQQNQACCLIVNSDQLAALYNLLFDCQDVPELAQVYWQICEMYGDAEDGEE